jgi:hypothetical protein
MRISSKKLLVLLAVLPLAVAADGGKAGIQSNRILNHIFRSTTFSGPSPSYVGLMSQCPTNTTPGSELAAANGYQRIAVPKGDTSWTLTTASYGAASQIWNTNAITFFQATANWTAACCFGIYDAVSAGSLIYWGPLSGPTINFANGTCTGGIVITQNSVASFAPQMLQLFEK